MPQPFSIVNPPSIFQVSLMKRLQKKKMHWTKELRKEYWRLWMEATYSETLRQMLRGNGSIASNERGAGTGGI